MGFNPLACVCGKFTIPQRYLMVLLLHLALLNSYHLRVVLNIAIVEMQAPKNHSSKVDACPMYKAEIVEVSEGKFAWPNSIEAFILYAFYIGYIFSHIPGGWLADKLGARWVLGTCLLVSIITNVLYPLAIKAFDYYGAVILRVIIGFTQGPIYPSLASFMQCWIPQEERSLLGAIIFSGSNLGTVTGSILTGIMIHASNSWTLPFYIWSLVAFIWYIFFMIWVYSRPSSHRFITDEEFHYLHHRVEERKQFKVPWIDLVKSVPIWALFFGQFAHNILFFTLFTNLPKYMKEILKLNLKNNTFFFALPFLLLWLLTFMFGYLAEVMEHKLSVPIGVIRKGYTFFSCFVPSVLLVMVPYMECNRTVVVILQTLSVGLLAPFFSGLKVNVSDITMHYGGIIMAVVNGFGASAGIIGPFIVGALTNNESLEEWKLVFWILGGISTGCALMFVIFSDTKRQSWDFVDDLSRQASSDQYRYH